MGSSSIKDRVRPALLMILRSIFSFPFMVNSTSTMAFSSPLLTSVLSPFPPKVIPMDFKMSDFPEPVSPVTTVNPFFIGSDNALMIAKFLIKRRCIIFFYFPKRVMNQ